MRVDRIVITLAT